ncbi:hypothetical protein INN71_00915 [Nocardioides sp. ChNu-153]|uniref:hypothetical protein n=1 Tax=unclassified Nocardioides TaxID=2615069 RepID=UPI00240755B1|nr:MULTISPECIES: hypothetical protein [unclassified Nocardioides]MDF9715977.1 hypothetical protein [Nocardioides sp. ChNu-99]MDN7119945.1 hypothetical protein [Nocardioides sp. ChNu-153]
MRTSLFLAVVVHVLLLIPYADAGGGSRRDLHEVVLGLVVPGSVLALVALVLPLAYFEGGTRWLGTVCIGMGVASGVPMTPYVVELAAWAGGWEPTWLPLVGFFLPGFVTSLVLVVLGTAAVLADRQRELQES